MKVLVCGGRDYQDVVTIYNTLDEIKPTMIIHGGARGADSIAGEYARDTGIQEVTCPANWNAHGKRAGILRNREMLRLKPDLVVAFPGGTGTADMVSISKGSGLRVHEVTDRR